MSRLIVGDGTTRQAAYLSNLSLGGRQGYRTDDPAGVVIDAALPRGKVRAQHLPALPYGEVSECLATVKGSRGASVSCKLALEFLILAAARSGEVRKATWNKIDLTNAVWSLPAERIKANREHRVPLSRRALEVLDEAADLSNGGGLVFPGGRPGRPLSENTHSKLIRELGFATVTHGFRFSFRDKAAEQTNTPHAVMEAALAHTVRDKVEAAYAQSDLFEKRRVLMKACARCLGRDAPRLSKGSQTGRCSGGTRRVFRAFRVRCGSSFRDRGH